MKTKENTATELVVRFFGANDHGWISRRRVYLYVDDDSSEPPKMKSYLDGRYTKGMEEARRIFEIIKNKKLQLRVEYKEKLHPQPFVRIKTNRTVPPVKLHANIEINKREQQQRQQQHVNMTINMVVV
uniref:Uncharacterized protein n=1 Tax=Glossina brevipalpis TaxID=37001 RepID=A0A1A9WFA5_9MUSC